MCGTANPSTSSMDCMRRKTCLQASISGACPDPTSVLFLGLPEPLEGFLLPEPLEAKYVSPGRKQRKLGNSHSPGTGQAGSPQETRPWQPEPPPFEAHLARTGGGNH